MKFDQHTAAHLSGEKFKSNFVLKIDREKQLPVSREQAIISIVENKNIIHIGCSDHIEIIEEKLRQNLWLHKLITDVSSDCIGIDIDKKSIDFIKNKLHYNNVFQGDIMTDDFPVIRERKWDYVLFGEVLEHLNDPVGFLKTFKDRYSREVSSFIISVPNIYSKHYFKKMLNYEEQINSDHRFWFTPYTVSKILVSAGLKPEELTFTNPQPLTLMELAERKVKKYIGLEITYPFYYFRTIIVRGSLI